MSVPLRRVATAAVIGACLATTGSAAASEPRLVAQIAQVTQPSGPGDEPQLSSKPPTSLSGQGGAGTTAPAAEPLAETGSDAAMVALAGLSLLGWGVALRLRLRDAA